MSRLQYYVVYQKATLFLDLSESRCIFRSL